MRSATRAEYNAGLRVLPIIISIHLEDGDGTDDDVDALLRESGMSWWLGGSVPASKAAVDVDWAVPSVQYVRKRLRLDLMILVVLKRMPCKRVGVL